MAPSRRDTKGGRSSPTPTSCAPWNRPSAGCALDRRPRFTSRSTPSSDAVLTLVPPLGNLFADAMRESVPGADVALNNNGLGGLRADLPVGSSDVRTAVRCLRVRQPAGAVDAYRRAVANRHRRRGRPPPSWCARGVGHGRLVWMRVGSPDEGSADAILGTAYRRRGADSDRDVGHARRRSRVRFGCAGRRIRRSRRCAARARGRPGMAATAGRASHGGDVPGRTPRAAAGRSDATRRTLKPCSRWYDRPRHASNRSRHAVPSL